MPAKKYTRVKDKRTGHEYDVLAHRFDSEKHERVKRYEDSSRPRPAKPNVKGPRPKRATAPGPGADPASSGSE